MAETAEDRIRRMKSEREGRPRVMSYNEDGTAEDLSSPKPQVRLAEWQPQGPGDSDRMRELTLGMHAGMGQMHPGLPLVTAPVSLEDSIDYPAGRNLYPTTGGDPTKKPGYNAKPKFDLNPPDALFPQNIPQAPRPAAKPATQEDTVRGLAAEVRQPAAAGPRPYTVTVGDWSWQGNGQASAYDPQSGRVRIWDPQARRGVTAPLHRLSPDQQQHVLATAPRGQVEDNPNPFSGQTGVLTYDTPRPGDEAPAARPAARPAAQPVAGRPAPPKPAPNAPAPQAPARQDARPVDPRERTKQDMHVIGKDWLYTKLVDAADAAGMPDPLAWSGEQLRIIVANDPNSKAHPLAVEALQNTPAARWAVPGGGRFAGGIEGAEPANRVIPAPEAGTETPLAAVPNPTIGVKGKAPAPRRPVGPGLPPPPAEGNGRPGAIPPAAPRGPAPNADPRKPPAPGMSRIATKGGKYVFDGEIESYDPKTNSVKVRTSTGQRVSIDYDSLDENSLRQFRGRVGEHNERVEFEDTKEDFDEKHGIGAYDNRFAPEMAYPEHRGTDGMGGARLAARRGVERDAARKLEVDKHNKAMLGVSPEPGPVADVPAKAKQAAEQAAGVDAPAAQPARQQQPREPAPLTEAQVRNARQAGADLFTTRLYNEWKRQADEQDASGAEVTPPPPSVVEMMDRKFKSAVMQYRRHVGNHLSEDRSLLEFAEMLGVDLDVVSEEAEIAGERVVEAARSHHLRTTEATNRHRESRMAPESRAAMHRKEAQAILRNPDSTPAQRAHAYTLAGEQDMAQTELNAHAATEAARHQAAAEAARAGGRVREEEKEPDALTVSVHDAVDSLPAGSSFDTMIAAGQHALESQGMADPKDQKTSRDRVISVLGDRAWQRLAGGTIAPGSAEAYYFWRIVIGRQAEVESAKADNATPPPPLSKNEFVGLASARGVKEQVAAKWYDRFRGASSPATEVGTDDSSAVE